MEIFVYVLQSESFDTRYVGMTINLLNRLEEHNKGKSKFTATYRPWKIIYFEIAQDRTAARKREKYLKSNAGRVFISKLIENGYVPFTDE